MIDRKTKIWIEATLTNDEVSTDEELVQHFMTEGKLTEEEAKRWVAKREKYLNQFMLMFPDKC